MFFMVLDLRLMEDWLSGDNLLFLCTFDTLINQIECFFILIPLYFSEITLFLQTESCSHCLNNRPTEVLYGEEQFVSMKRRLWQKKS